MIVSIIFCVIALLLCLCAVWLLFRLREDDDGHAEHLRGCRFCGSTDDVDSSDRCWTCRHAAMGGVLK